MPNNNKMRKRTKSNGKNVGRECQNNNAKCRLQKKKKPGHYFDEKRKKNKERKRRLRCEGKQNTTDLWHVAHKTRTHTHTHTHAPRHKYNKWRFFFLGWFEKLKKNTHTHTKKKKEAAKWKRGSGVKWVAILMLGVQQCDNYEKSEQKQRKRGKENQTTKTTTAKE